MEYKVPFGINIVKKDKKVLISRLAQEDYLAQVIKTVADTMKTGGFFGIW